MGALLKRPDIFLFDDFREYLRSQVDYLMDVHGESVRSLSIKSGFKSSNYLKHIIDGKRKVSRNSANNICKAIHLNKFEADYFLKLASFNQSVTLQQKRETRTELLRSKRCRNLQPKKVATVNYYSKWYYVPLRELIALTDFKEDPTWIAKKLRRPVSESEISKAIDDMIELGMVVRDENGQLKQAERTLRPSGPMIQSALYDFQLNMIDQAKDALETLSKDERNVSSVTITLNEEARKKVELMIYEFRQNLLKLSEECQSADEVAQVNLQFFPLTQKLENIDDDE